MKRIMKKAVKYYGIRTAVPVFGSPSRVESCSFGFDGTVNCSCGFPG